MHSPRKKTTDRTGNNSLSKRIRIFTWILMTSWTLLICASWFWSYHAEQNVFYKVALAEANTVIERDSLYRRWGASHGGVYAPVTQKTTPSPYLSHVPERDITSPSGKQLTLINPAYMTRQVNDFSPDGKNFFGQTHLTSLKPLRPENAPDAWESKALHAFEDGAQEVSAIITTGGKPFMRLIRPFIAEKSCLKCHTSMGYSVGSLLGGISVSIPIQPLIDVGRSQIFGSLAFHGMIWLLGLGVAGAGSRHLSISALAQKQVENQLQQQTLLLEDEIIERQTAQTKLEELNCSLEDHIARTVAELRHKDQTLIQQSRLAAMGEMIHNIAHQWRQPLNNVGLIIQNLQFSFDAGTVSHDELKKDIDTAMDVIIHMSRTIDDFRNFFREDKQKCSFPITKTVRHALEFVSAALESNAIQVELEADESITATGYQNEYAQVLLNILSNTREACIERQIAAPRIHIQITCEDGRSVVRISDNCGGIPEDIMPKIFDPYFTTRSPDKGSGIGLYMSKVIIEQNMNGRLTAKNIESGVEFRIEI